MGRPKKSEGKVQEAKKAIKKGKKTVKETVESTSEDLFGLISEQIDSFVENAKKYKEKGTVAAAARARKSTLALTKLFKDYRKVTNEEKKNK